MGIKLLWTGLVIMLAVSKFLPLGTAMDLVGAIIMMIGGILLWMDK